MASRTRLVTHQQPSLFDGVVRRTVRRSDLLAHSVAVLTPSLSALGAGLNLPRLVGPGFWISTILGYTMAFLLAAVISEFSQRFASGGSLYTFTAKGLAPMAALLVSVSLFLGYGLLASAGVSGSVERAELAWQAFGGSSWTSGSTILAILIVTALCLACIAAGIALASRVAFAIEAVAVVALFVVLVTLLWRYGLPDMAVFSLQGASPSRIAAGAAYIASLTVAFESSAALGLEAQRPMRDVPAAMRMSLLLTGGLFVLANIVGTVLPESMSVWDFRWFGSDQGISMFDGGILALMSISYFALGLCVWNSLARLVFSLGREGLMPRVCGRTTANGVPLVAACSILPIVLLAPAVVALSGDGLYARSWDVLRTATVVLSVAYGLTAVALIFFLARIEESRWRTTLLAVACCVGVVFVVGENAVRHLAAHRYVTFYCLGMVVLGAVLWRGAVAGRLRRGEATLGAHQEPSMTYTVVADHQESGRGTSES